MPFGPKTINNFYTMGEVNDSQFRALRENINWHKNCKNLTNNQVHWNTTRKGELTWFPSSLLTLSARFGFTL